MNAGEALQGIWAAWIKRDKAATLEFFSHDVEYAIFIPQEVLPFGGVTRGKAALSDRLQMILDQFDTLSYAPVFHGSDNDTARGIVHYHFAHKATGETIDGLMRHVAKMKDGLIVRLEEYHDIDRIQAFMRLVSQRANALPAEFDE